ncbi:unnamed protein product [Alternaria burnsii]|nr:unnamed protein product [Alternaria burnsii]
MDFFVRLTSKISRQSRERGVPKPVDTADEVIINCGSIVCVPCLDLHMLAAPGETVCNLLRNTKSTIARYTHNISLRKRIQRKEKENLLPASPLRSMAAFQPHLKSTMIQLKIDIREYSGLGQTRTAPKDSAVPEWGS